MAIGTALAVGGVRALGSAIGYFAGRGKKPKRFGATPAGEFYRRIGSGGRFSQQARSQILSRTGQAASDIAQRRSADVRGYLASQGFGGSVAGAALVDAPQAGVQKLLGGTARDIEIENELSKVEAQERLALGETGTDEARRAYSRALTQNLIGGVTGAVAGTIGEIGDIRRREGELEAGFANRLDVERIRQSGRINQNVSIPANLSSFRVEDIKRFAFDNKLSEEEMMLLMEIWDSQVRQTEIIQ